MHFFRGPIKSKSFTFQWILSWLERTATLAGLIMCLFSMDLWKRQSSTSLWIIDCLEGTLTACYESSFTWPSRKWEFYFSVDLNYSRRDNNIATSAKDVFLYHGPLKRQVFNFLLDFKLPWRDTNTWTASYTSLDILESENSTFQWILTILEEIVL